MLKLRITQAGLPEQVVTIDGDCALIGRKKERGVDVVVNRPFVSGKHAIVLKGVVVVDQGSVNGTFVEGEKICEATLAPGGVFALGTGNDAVQIVVDADGEEFLSERTLVAGALSAARPDAAVAALREELEQTRIEKARLAEELRSVRAGRNSADGGDDSRLAAALRENADLEQRIATLKEGVESHAIEAGEHVQVRLAQESLADVQRRNAELEKRMAEIEARPRDVRVVAGEDAISVRLLELETQLTEKDASLSQLKAELESARKSASSLPKSAAAPTDLFVRLNREIQELREKLAAASTATPSPSTPAGGKGAAPVADLFVQLQSENRDLRRRVSEMESAASRSAVSPEKAHEPARPRDEIPRPPAKAPTSTPLPKVPATHPPQSGPAAHVLRRAVEDDVDCLAPLANGSADEFLALEAFRFARQVEKIVTRIVGDSRQVFSPNTMLPEVVGNLRMLSLDLLDAPLDPATRNHLLAYMDELRGWLLASIAAPRKAAERFASEVRKELSEEGLTKHAPLPASKKIPVVREAELWRRVCAALKELTPDTVDDRIERLVRAEVMAVRVAPAKRA